MRNPKQFRRMLFRFIPVPVVALLLFSSPENASAQSLSVGNCVDVSTNTFLDNEPVCVSGTTAGDPADDPDALVCVLPSTGGLASDDVTPDGCNSFPPAFTMSHEPVWLPPTVPENYIVVLFASDESVFQQFITISSSVVVAPTINADAIKVQAGFTAARWEATAVFGESISNFDAAFSLGVAAATGDVVGVVVGIAGTALNVPADYDATAAMTAGQIIATLAKSQADMYTTLEANSPDAMFTDFMALDVAAINANNATLAPLMPHVPLAYPFANLSQDPLHLAMMRFVNSMTLESATGTALTRTLEKLQGAEVADDDEHRFLQARALKKYTDLIQNQLAVTRQAALDYKTELTADGLATTLYSGAEIAALTARLLGTGFTAEEELDLRGGGFTDADFAVMMNRLGTLSAPPGLYSPGSGLNNIVSSIDQLSTAFLGFGNQAQAIVDHFATLLTVQHPSADAGGPYNGNEGIAVIFDASNSSDPAAQVITLEWDFDLDGQFDDASGAVVNNTYDAPIATLVGLRVTDTDGNVDIAYATVSIAEVNVPPQITSFEPVGLTPTASNAIPLAFTATATDPDMDAVSYEWRVDGAVASTASDFTYTPGVGEAGTRTVRLTVSDSNPLSEDTFETRLVRIEQPVLPLVVPLPDVTSDAIEDIAVIREGSIIAEIRSGANGALLKNITFLDARFTAVDAVALPDSDGDGGAELAVLATRISDGSIVAEIRNVSGVEAPRFVWFAANHTPVAIEVIDDDADGNGVAELAVLSTRNSDGRIAVEVKNAFGPTNTNIAWFMPGNTPVDLEVVPDKDANGIPEIAVLSSRNSDGRIVTELKNAAGATVPSAVWFMAGNTAIDLVAVDDKDANGIPEVAVLSSRNSDGRNVVEIKNASGPTAATAVWLMAGRTATDVAHIHDSDNNGVPEIAVLSVADSDGRIMVEVKNASGPSGTNTIWYSPGFASRGLATLADTDSNGIEEALVLMVRGSDGRILVQGRNAAGNPASIQYWFSP